MELSKGWAKVSHVIWRAIQIILAIFVGLPLLMLLLWYLIAFLPSLPKINELASRGAPVAQLAGPRFYQFAVLDRSESQRRIAAVRFAYFDLVLNREHRRARRLWQLEWFLWQQTSWIYLDDREIFSIWCACAISKHCDASGLSNASEKYFGKPLNELSDEQLAAIAVMPHAPSRFVPGSERGERRVRHVLSRAKDL